MRKKRRRSRGSIDGRGIDKENEREAMVVGGAVEAPYYREIKGSNSSRDFY